MNYYIDTEFLEGKQSKTFLGYKYGETKPTIDLISIGIVSEGYCANDTDGDGNCGYHPNGCPDGREYYAISKDFNLKEAWNRYEMKETSPAKKYMGFYEEREYWLRDNVLKPIFQELLYKGHIEAKIKPPNVNEKQFTYKNLKGLINKYGKTNDQIAKEIERFVRDDYNQKSDYKNLPKFYAYYADYDWVAFCWLFGKMIDLPKGFPKYCVDLKQIYDEFQNSIKEMRDFSFIGCTDYKSMVLGKNNKSFSYCALDSHKDYPKKENEHNALADARWNKKLYEFLIKL